MKDWTDGWPGWLPNALVAGGLAVLLGVAWFVLRRWIHRRRVAAEARVRRDLVIKMLEAARNPDEPDRLNARLWVLIHYHDAHSEYQGYLTALCDKAQISAWESEQRMESVAASLEELVAKPADPAIRGASRRVKLLEEGESILNRYVSISGASGSLDQAERDELARRYLSLPQGRSLKQELAFQRCCQLSELLDEASACWVDTEYAALVKRILSLWNRVGGDLSPFEALALANQVNAAVALLPDPDFNMFAGIGSPGVVARQWLAAQITPESEDMARLAVGVAWLREQRRQADQASHTSIDRVSMRLLLRLRELQQAEWQRRQAAQPPTEASSEA